MSSDYSRTDLLPRKAPRFLDDEGRRRDSDELALAWQELKQHFIQLHGQRLVELMGMVFSHMPENERIWPEWEQDENYHFFLRFSNGWSMGEYTETPDEPCRDRFDHRNEAVAPDWFPRDTEGFSLWVHWYSLLNRTTISAEVDATPLNTLEALAKRKQGLGRGDLPDIAQALVGAEWQACLEQMDLAEHTAAVGRATPRARL